MQQLHEYNFVIRIDPMDPQSHREKRDRQQKHSTYRANVRKHTSILKYLMSTGVTKQKEINRAYSNLAIVDWNTIQNSPELKSKSKFVYELD